MGLLRSFLNHLEHDPEAVRLANEGGSAFVSLSLRPFVVAALADQDAKRPALVVVGDDRGARDLAADLRAWLAPRPVRYYPSRGVTYESHLTPPPHLVGLRVAALDALTDTAQGAEQPVVVISAVALSEKVPDPKLRPHGFSLRVGDLLDLDETAQQLVAAGYERVDQVDERGQFAIRGGLLDVYPATEERAVRVDLFDIEIEALRWFSTFTQRSLGETDCVQIAPAAELAPEHRELAEIAATDEDRPDIAELLPVEHFRELLELLPARTNVIVAADEDVEPFLRDHGDDACTAFDDQDARHLYVNPKRINEQLGVRASARLSSISHDQKIEIRGQAADFAARNLTEAESELEKLVRADYTTVVAWPQKGAAERAAYNLARIKASLNGGTKGLIFNEASLRDGFVAPGLKLAAFPEHRLIHRKKASTKPARRGRGLLRSFTDLRTGDYIVHEDHGVARFAGFDTKTVAGVTRDYLNLEFQGDDKVFLPVDQLAKISRYLGADGGAPTLSKLGGTRGDKVRARARRAAQELAGELLNLYAERKRRRGHAFPEFSEELRDLEANFPYRETPDQRDAIESVIADMESERPMDRLICGDVGYGKTEVALRAAVKAASDGKQVLMLVPTTILAQQHYGTFTERLRDQPFVIEQVSRFRPPAEQREAVKRFSEGKVDILIGTHRVLSRDVRAKELGLLIVDEEQRFGVKQKELLRQLKLKVDVISMSATPIPRTLQMSLAGLRDISVIETPPEGRRPVKTYVGEYDEQLVKQALEREAARGGQSFFVHNRVETIDETAERLRGLCPGVRFEVAHGQLEEKELEQRMMRFLRGDADVLVATSIIESGIDIPQANTLIVERADVFGLAQLYQIRGRVGRSRERAYSYLQYPSAAALTEEATKCLSALSDYTELGAGFKIAMRDLEIRGAGNLLGDEQSGHVAALGFELYMSMLDEAGRAREGEGFASEDEPEPVRLDVNVDAYVPADYIAYEQAKIDVHRRVAGAREVAELQTLREELEDRFGPLPEPLENLLTLQQARIKLGEAGARAVSFRGGRLAVTPIDLDAERAKRLKEQMPEALYEPGKSQFSVRIPDDPERRFPAVVHAANALLAVQRSAA